MSKGFHRESLREALSAIVQPDTVMSFSELIVEIKKRGPWKDDTIYQNLMSHVRNLVPAKFHWHDGQERLLFLRPDGRYERYDQRIHPKVIE